MKTALKLVFAALIALIAFTSCQTTEKGEVLREVDINKPPLISFPPFFWQPQSTSNVPEKDSPNDFKPLKLSGDNLYSTISPDGKYIAYSSFNREFHPHGEVYTFRFSDGLERRLTFQKANALYPTFNPNGKNIVYSSATEELLERPDIYIESLRNKAEKKDRKTYPAGLTIDDSPKDIFLQFLQSSSRRRVTKVRGQESEPSFSNSGKRIVYSTIENGDSNIFSINLRGHSKRKVISDKGYDGQLRVSPNHKNMAWVHKANGQEFTEIKVSTAHGKGKQRLKLPNGIHFWPKWHRDSEWIVFSSNMNGESHFSLYVAHKDKGCLTRLTYDDVHAIFPEPHPVEDKLYYSRYDRKGWTIGWIPFSPPKTCLEPTP